DHGVGGEDARPDATGAATAIPRTSGEDAEISSAGVVNFAFAGGARSRASEAEAEAEAEGGTETEAEGGAGAEAEAAAARLWERGGTVAASVPGPPLPPGLPTVVVAGDGAGSVARKLAEARGWPLLAEPASGSRGGPSSVPAYRLL